MEITTTAKEDLVVARVRDNGCGMPEDVRARIFDPFFTTKPPGEGTGYGIVTGYGGEITCKSVEGEGTTFTLRFPINEGNGAQMDTKLLLIDDDVRILQTFARALKLADYDVLTAPNGEEGLALYHQEAPDIILLDLRMPGMDGLEVLQTIREHDPEANVILATGHGDKDAVIEALRAGASDFLSKPIDQVTLESALRRAEERIDLKRKLRASQEELRQHNLHLEEKVRARTAELEREIKERKQTEVTLREREKQYRTVSELVSDYAYAFRVEPDGTLVGEWVTEAFYRITGYTPDELPTGESWARIFHPEDLPAVTDHIAKIVDGTPHELDYRIRTKAGEVRWLRTHDRPEWDTEAGRVTRIYGAVQDITDRKRAEEALKESEERLKLVIKGSNDAPWDWDLIENELFYSPQWWQQLGYVPNEIPADAHLWEKLMHPDDSAEVDRVFRGALQKGQESYAVEFRLQHKDGHYVPVLSRGFITFDAQKKPIRVSGTNQDLTERKQAEERLRFQAQLLEAVEQAVIVTDMEGHVIYWNPFAERLYGWAAEEALGKTTLELIASEESLQHGAEIMACLQAGESWSGDYLARRRDGSLFPIQATNTPIYDAEGALSHIIGVSVDITARKQAEEALHRQNEYLRALQETTLELISQLDLDTLLENTVKRAGELVGTSAGFLDLVDLATNRLVPCVGVGALAESLQYTVQPGEGLAGIVWQTGEPLVIDDYDSWTNRIEEFGQNTLGSIIGVPLLSGKNVLGVLGLAYPAESQQTFDTEAIDHLMQFARLATIAIENSRLLEQTQEDAETKTMLLQEINHRVLNNLTAIMGLLDMEQRRPLGDVADLRAVLDDVSLRIGGMTAVHRMLSSAQWQPLDVRDVVAQAIHGALSSSPIRHQIEIAVNAPGDPLRVPSKQAISLALVINELTTNSAKYAFQDRSEGQIDVEIALLDEETIQVIFHDDGPGMPDAVLAGEQRDVGLWLAETNVRHTLGGKINYHNDGGAVVTFTLARVPLDWTEEQKDDHTHV